MANLTQEEMDHYQSLELMDAIKEMKVIKGQLEEAKRYKSELEAKHDFLRINVIPEKMDEQDVSNMTVDNVGRVSLTGDVRASILAADREKAYEWFEENGFGDLVKQSVASSTLKAFVKEQLKKGGDIPEELIKVTPFTRASITKVK